MCSRGTKKPQTPPKMLKAFSWKMYHINNSMLLISLCGASSIQGLEQDTNKQFCMSYEYSYINLQAGHTEHMNQLQSN